jgi:hypothetical protein
MRSRKEIEEGNLLPAGIYDYFVEKAEEKVSSKGNFMICLTLKVHDSMGRQRPVFDNLMESFEEKLFSFAESNGFQDSYGQGELSTQMCESASGTVEIIIKPSRIDSNNNEWRARNEVKKYLPKRKIEVDSDVPF